MRSKRPLLEEIMASNEHPDMSGNPCDDPVICDQCGDPCDESNLYGCLVDEDKNFCSADCVHEYEDGWEWESKAFEKVAIEELVMRPRWPEGLEARKVYRFQCDDCCPQEDTKDFTVVVSEDGDVWLGMLEINEKHTSQPYRNPSPTVRCRTGIGGGRHRRTRQALLWLARAIQLDNEELGIKD